MRRSSQLSAAQLAALCGLGGVIAASSFFVLFNPWTVPHHRPPHFTPLLILWLILILIGGVIAFRSASSLESGIANERWPEAEIDSLRTLNRSRTANVITFALLIGFVALAFPSARFRPLGWSLLLLLQTLNFLRAHIPPKPTPPRDSPWTNLSPIRSEHWGQP
jgi:hypothetical protein